MSGENVGGDKIAMILMGAQSFPCIHLLLTLSTGVGTVRREMSTLQMIFAGIFVTDRFGTNLANISSSFKVLGQILLREIFKKSCILQTSTFAWSTCNIVRSTNIYKYKIIWKIYIFYRLYIGLIEI